MDVRFSFWFHRSSISRCASSALSCFADSGKSANTVQAQGNIQNGDGRRRHTRDARSLAERPRARALQFVLHFAGQSRNPAESERRGNRPAFSVLHSFHLPLLLRDIAAKLGRSEEHTSELQSPM